jgi:hypothetical protein
MSLGLKWGLDFISTLCLRRQRLDICEKITARTTSSFFIMDLLHIVWIRIRAYPGIASLPFRFSRRSLTVLLGACGTRRAQTRSFEGTLHFPQRGKLARLEAPLSFSLRSRNHARSASSHGLLYDLVFAHPSWFPRRTTDLFKGTGRSGVPRGYAPLVAGRKSENGRQGAERTLEGVFPSKEVWES